MSWDPVWEDVFQNNEWGKYPSEEVIRFVARNFYSVVNRKNITILEVGCGPGANLWYAAREGFSIIGVDGSETAIAKAKQRLDKEVPGWNGHLYVGDIKKLDLPDSSVDAVIDSEAIYANEYDVSCAIFKEIARVLKPGGKVFSKTFATGMVGDQTGEKVGHNAWIVAEGPLEGKGFSRFTSRSEIYDLVKPLSVQSLELVERSWDGLDSGKRVSEFVIVAEKKAER